MDKAIFLDRDGVLIENRDQYVQSWADVQIYSGVLSTLARLADLEYKVILVTNQSAVGRGIITHHEADDINERLVGVIKAAGGKIDRVYMCPHTPQAKCRCRKPEPGMFIDAAVDLNLDLSKSIMVGDAASDLVAANAAGIPELILVLTGRGIPQKPIAEKTGLPFKAYDSLKEAMTKRFPM
jgi:histidinol-phosphate phosphatase family protein